MKTTKEMIDVMQAYERGEQIQLLNRRGIWVDIDMPEWSWARCDYRVKPKKSYVPFDTAEEFLAAQRAHGETVRCKADGFLFHSYVNECGDVALLSDYEYTKMTKIGSIFFKYEFADGTQCGKEEK